MSSLRRREREKSKKNAEKALAERKRRGLETTTLERILRADGKLIVNSADCQVVNQSILDTMYWQGLISHRQYEAAERFREDAYNSGMVWSLTSLREPSARSSVDQRLPAFAMRGRNKTHSRWSGAVARLGMDGNKIIDAIVWPRDSGMLRERAGVSVEAIEGALDILADHYRVR